MLLAEVLEGPSRSQTGSTTLNWTVDIQACTWVSALKRGAYRLSARSLTEIAPQSRRHLGAAL